MAYKDRGYGTTIDNYKAQQEKKKRQQEQRKQNETKYGPVSAQKATTLSLPKVNSTATSRAASTSAPIQTQRFTQPGFSGSSGKFEPTSVTRGNSLTQSEFNRSPAMIRSYGNYDNYLKGVHVTGSGFSDPDLLFRNEPDLKAIETAQNQFDQALNVVSGNFEQKASAYERWYRTVTNQYQPMTDAQKAQGDQLYADYTQALSTYQKMADAHMSASAHNAGIYASVSNQRKQWYDSIRDEKDIDVEEKDLLSQLELLENQRTQVESANSYAKTQALHGITTAEGLETVMNSTDELNRIDRQIEEVRAQIELLDKERAYSRYFKWQNMANNDMPVSAIRVQGRRGWLEKAMTDTGPKGEGYKARNDWAEEQYRAINEGNINPSNIAEMLDDERQTYQALYEKYGPDVARQYYEELEKYGNIRESLNTRRRMTDEASLRKWVEKGSPFGRQLAASVLTVLASPTKAFSYVGQGAEYLLTGEMTKDAEYNVFSYAPNAVTAQIGQNITKWGEEHGSKWVQEWGEFGYQTALSMLTFLYTTALTGGFGLSSETMEGVALYEQGYRTAQAVSAYKAYKTAETLSLGLMGTEAAADAVMQAKDRGLDDGQAFWMGTAAGAIEILTEKFSVENLLEGVGDRNRLLYFLKNVFAEGSEEVASDLSNMLVDSLVAKDKSEFNQSVKDYMKQYGVSKEEALKAVWTQQLKNIGLSGLGGALSGGVMAGGRMALNTTSNYLFNRNSITSPENVARIASRGQDLSGLSEGYRSAQALQAKLASGEKMTVREVLRAREAIETDRKTDPKYVGALIEAAQDYGDSDAKKQADKLQAKLDNGKVKVEDVENLEEAIDLERLVDPNREDLQSALKYGETADQKSEAYKLTKGVRDKIAAGEKLSLEEVSAAESAVNTAKATSAEGLKSTIESGLASDKNSAAYKSAQQLQSKLDSGAEITLAEVNEAKRAVRAAENAAYKSLDPNVVGKYLVTENGRKALTDAATILKNSTSESDVQRGNQILQAIKDGNLDAKTAGEVFLRSQKILENTRKQRQNIRVLKPREVTADMDAYDRSAAELGISEEEASHNKAILQAFGVEGEYKSFENNNLSAYYDRSTGKVYINANADNPGLALIAHEVTHSFENTAAYRKLADLVFSQSKDLNADLQRITQEYADAGINLDDAGARSELVTEFVEQHMFNDEKFIKDVVSTDRSLAQKILRTLDNLLAKLGNKNAQQRQLLREARDLWAEALQQRMTSDKSKAKIAEKRSDGKLTLPTVEAKAAAVRKTEGPKNLSLSRANDGIQAGIRQAVLTAGIDISRDSSGKLVFKIGGESVDHVTADHIRDSSAFGAMISLARDGVVDNEGNTILKGHITEDEANEQYQAVADLMNTVMTTQNPEMVWELAGSQMFAAVKSNSDGQYGTTVDFTTVCRKTQEMITAMSERMMAKKGGLTKAEVIELQADLIEANLNVPCPVCYVFSRWAGVGTLLDNMYKFQQKYANMTDAELAEAIERLRARDKKADRARLRSDLRNPESTEFDEAYYDLVSTRERLRADNKALRKQLKTAEKNGIQADIDSLSKSIAFNNDSIKNLDKQIKDIENAADTAGKELVWLEKVRTKATYKAVPAEILFNMADGEAIESFMRDYPDSWSYRTTRGPAMGKAITPYSDMRLGDLFMSLKSNSAAAFAKGRGNVFSNPLGVKGKFNKKQMNEIVKAIARTRAQNLIGGQRFQSTSDFRYDYALDYIQTFFEAQALGSNMQTYTKIIEFGEMVAKIGGDVNLSVMPRNKGYEGGKLTYADGNYSGGTLIYSNVTGINFGAAKLLSEKYDSAQLILVGINDDHIRLALNDTTDTGGAHVGFVIPYHASGASIDTFIRELVKNLNEEFKRENYTDYSTVQTDTEKAGATALQRRLRDLRKAILTGNRTILQKVMDENGRQAVDSNGDPKFTKKTIPWIPKRSEIDFMRNLAKNKTDISDRSFEDLLDVERRALQGDQEAIRDYESWSADLLLNLYKKMWTRNGAENGVRLNSSQAAAIMPHEYWDTNSTRDTAYLNNFIFRSYCYNLGLNPRFTGIDSKGNVVDFGDFSDCRGYWKTLIDRAMYDNNGNYRAQQPINMSRLEVGMIQEEEGRKAWGDAVVKKPDVAKAREVGKQYAISKSQDTAYLKAVESGDMETAQRMVDEAARNYIQQFLLPNDDDEVGFKYHRGPAPTKTFKRYAVMNVSPDGFRAAYAGNKNATPIGVWLDAQNLQSYTSDLKQFDDGTFATYIPGGTGSPASERFSPEALQKYGLKKSQKMLLERGGKHSSDVPNFSQMNLQQNERGEKVKNKIRDGALPHNKLVFEIEYGISDDGDLTDYVRENGRMMKGKNQGLQHIQPNQYYDFKTNPNAVGNWGIGGTFRVLRLVPHSEIVSATNQYKADAIDEANRLYEAGEISKKDRDTRIKNAEAIQVQKWVDGYHPEDFGLSEKLVADMAKQGSTMKLTDAVTYDDNGDVIPLSERFNPEKKDLRYAINRDATIRDDGLDFDLPDLDISEGRDEMDEIIRDIRMYAGDTTASRLLAEMAQQFGTDYVEKYIRTQGPSGSSVKAIRSYLAEQNKVLDLATNPKLSRMADSAEALEDFYDSVSNMIDPGRDSVATTSRAKPKATTRMQATDAGRFLYRKMVDSGEAVSRLGKYSNDPHLYPYYNMARASSNAAVSMIQGAQTNVMGERVGDGLNDIFSAIRAKGDQYYEDLQLYLYHMLNIERMSRENPAAVESVREELSDFRKNNPELNGMTDAQLQQLAYDPISMYHEQAQQFADILTRLQIAQNTRNKPVFGGDVTDSQGHTYRKAVDAKASRKAAEELRGRLSETEGFEQDVEKIYAYIDNLMKYRIDSGLITEEDYQKLRETYPHYVPAFYELEQEDAKTRKTNQTQVGKTVGRAKGSTKYVLMPLHKALAQQTFSVVREGSKNRFGQMLLDKQGDSRGMIKSVEQYNGDFHEDTFDQPEDKTLKKGNSFIVRQDGKRWEMILDNAMYEAVDVLSPTPQEANVFLNVARSANDLFKALCTGYNPTFLVRNFMRDLQDAGLYSKDLSEFAKQYPKAIAEIAKNGRYWQQYQALGGLYSSIFDYQTGELKQSGKLKRMTLDKIESVNMAVEQAPRLAEFMATVKKAEKAGGVTMDTLMEAMYNAADVTVNFGRSGKWGKMLNQNWVPFLNPGIQGFDKMIRNVTETKGFKDWARLVAKASILGIAPAIISKLLFGKRKDWDEIKDRDKDIYYLFPLNDDGLWLKLPKGRVLSIFGMAADRAMRLGEGKDVDWGGFINTALSQTAPENPLTSNILKAWYDTKLFNPDNPGQTWYGTDIESQRLRNLAPGQRYDTSTDKISKWLGKTFNLSPKKINYLIDQYTGVIGDIALPFLSDKAKRDMFSNAFTLDTVSSNRLSEDFYGMKDQLTWAKNDPDSTGEDEALYKYWNEQTSAISDINKAIRAIEEDKTLSRGEKQDLVRVQNALRNSIMRDALDSMRDYRYGGTDNDIYSRIAEAQAQEARESATYNFKGKDIAWDDLSGTQKKIVQAQDALKDDPDADLSEIIGKGNATKKLAQYQAARDQGISNQTYIDALQAIDDADDGNGNYNQAEAKAGLDKLISDGTISEKEAGTLWKIITGGADKNNPFPVGAIISRPMGLRLPKIG